MSRTPNLWLFNPERWGYMALVVGDLIENEWKNGRLAKPPAGILSELRNFVELALKGFRALQPDLEDFDTEHQDLTHNVMSIVSDSKINNLCYGDGAAAAELFKKLENQLCVLEKSNVPTIVLDGDSLNFFERFFRQLNLLGELEFEKRQMEECDE